jgi:hypothetical protein
VILHYDRSVITFAVVKREHVGLILFGVAVAAVVAIGIGVRATYGAQVTADEPQYLLSALSLWEDGDLDISDELADERYRAFHEAELPQQTMVLEDGSRISPHDPLLPVLLAAPMGLGGWVGAKAALAVMGGLLAALIAWTAINRLGVSRPTAYLTAGLFALAPPIAMYATQVYPAMPAAVVTMAGLAALLGSFERGGRVVVALSVIALPWLAVKFIPVAAVLAVAGLVKAGRGRRLGLLVTFAGAGVVYVLGHLLIYDGLTAYATGDHFVGGELTVVGTNVDLWGRSTRLVGLLIDGGFGIGAWQPAFLLLPLVAGWALARRRPGLVTAAALVAVGWLVATFVALTMHGWWFPGRQLVVVLPIAVLLIAAWADEERWRRGLLTVTGAIGVIASGFLLVEGLGDRLTWVVDFGSTVDPFYRALSFALPDYMAPTTSTWVLHGLWVAAVLSSLWLGWHSGSSRDEQLNTTELDREGNQERVLT